MCSESDSSFEMKEGSEKESSDKISLENESSGKGSSGSGSFDKESHGKKKNTRKGVRATKADSNEKMTTHNTGDNQSKIISNPCKDIQLFRGPSGIMKQFSVKHSVNDKSTLRGQIWPEFISEEFIMDAKERRPSDPDYDSSTLFISEKQMKKLSAFFRQYWKIKSKHFDSIVILGNAVWYYCFFNDLSIMKRIMGREMKVYFGNPGFHNIERDSIIRILTNHGYRVVL
jgi:hypothetical protein